jgi:hypothetical protein
MIFELHHPTETTLGAGAAAAIVVSGLAILLGGFPPDGGDVLQARGQRLASTLDRLGFAHAFAYGEILQAAADAMYVSVKGRPEREHRSAQREGIPGSATGRPEHDAAPDGEPSSPKQAPF